MNLFVLTTTFSDMFKKKEEKESDDKELTETDGNE